MSRLVWDQNGQRTFETGVKYGVLYPINTVTNVYDTGYAWNGLTGVTESPSGAEATALYADDIKYLNLMSAEEFGGTIEAYTYPDEFAVCDGSATLSAGVHAGQQARKVFGLCYRTTIGNDVDGNDHGYKLHLIYGCQASPSERAYATINDSPEAITFSWEFSTTPVNVTGFKPTSLITIDSTKVNAAQLTQLENALYGDATHNPRLPLPDEVVSIIGTAGSYAITNMLVNVENSNTAVAATGAYTGTLSAVDGYTIKNVIVTMNGVDVTTTAYTTSTHVISIASVTGPVTIYATANAT